MKCIVCGGSTKKTYSGLFDDRYGAPGKHDIYRCTRCDFGRIHPGLKPSEIGEFYAKYYPLSAQTPKSVKEAAKIMPRWQSWLNGTDNIGHHYSKQGLKVLDIGSASGVSLLEIEQLGARAYGVEPDPTAAKLAKKLKLKVHTGFITDNPFPGESFDLITASQVIEHTPDPKKFLKAVSSRLNHDGYVVLSFPNSDALFRRIFGGRWLHWHIPYHYNFFTRKALRELAKQAGLEVVKVRTITPNLWTVIQLRSLSDKPQEGKMGSVWAAQHGKSRTSAPPSLVVRAAQQAVLKGLNWAILLVNRSVDSLGLGESFLVFLKKKV